MLGDISNIHNNLDLVHILTAVLVVDMIIILIARDTTILGKTINEWYNKFTMTAVLLDVLIIVIGFIITRYTFNVFDIEYSPELFIIILLTVQIVHDVLLYKFVIAPYPEGHNQVIDVYKKYADENGYKVIIADSAMMLGSAVLAMYLKNKDMNETTSLLIISLYIIPYFIYQKVKY
jgi:uncharacterized protein YacL